MLCSSYSDQLRQAMADCGQPVSAIISRAGEPLLRFDAMDFTEDTVSFLWLGKPVFMARKSEGHLVHVRGETAPFDPGSRVASCAMAALVKSASDERMLAERSARSTGPRAALPLDASCRRLVTRHSNC